MRRKMFENGIHSETTYALIVTYVPPKIREKKVTDLMYDNPSDQKEESPFTKNLNHFREKLYTFEENLKSVLKLNRMGSIFSENEFNQTIHNDEIINYINYCLTGQYVRINIPSTPIPVTSLLGVETFQPGLISVLGNKSIVCVSVNGYPIESTPAMLSALDKLPCEYRLSHRFIMLPRETAISITKTQQRKWQQKIRGMRDQFNNTAKGPINQDAVAMTEEAGQAYSEIESNLVSYGLHACVIVLMGNDAEKLFENATLTQRILAETGFTSCIEDINTTEAFLGSLPGNKTNNIRQVPISTIVLADILPTTSIWPGLQYCPHPGFPPKTPALMHASTEGITPFRFNLHVNDVGHTLIFGPTGAGKSTFIGLILAQFRAFKDAKIYAFDKGYSLYTLTRAIKGDHYDLAGKSSQLQFSPLKEIDNPHDFQWAVDWISILIQLQLDRKITPNETEDITEAMKLLKDSNMRSLMDFKVLLQNTNLRTCIDSYTGVGVLGDMLDNEQDNLSLSDFSVFELEHLMKLEEKFLLPVLLYIFHRIENSLNGEPTILSLDEGWIVLGNKTFREKLIEWLNPQYLPQGGGVLPTQEKPDQAQKKDFLTDANEDKVSLVNAYHVAKSPFELKQGHLIPMTLITKINSDLPGRIKAQVTENVYDTATGNHLLIPQGTMINGIYDSRVVFGQKRVLVAWQRLIFPDGSSLNVGSMPGTDQEGTAGVSDLVDNHYFQVFGSALLMSVINAGFSIATQTDETASDKETASDSLAKAAAQQMQQTFARIIDKIMSIQPELVIRSGKQGHIILTKDVIGLKPYNPAQKPTYFLKTVDVN